MTTAKFRRLTRLFNIQLHEAFHNPAQVTLRRYRSLSLEKRLHTELNKLCHGPRNHHRTLSEISHPNLTGIMRRARVGRFRLIFLSFTEEKRIFPLYLSSRPRNGYDYENISKLEDLALEILADFETQQYEKFARWDCK